MDTTKNINQSRKQIEISSMNQYDNIINTTSLKEKNTSIFLTIIEKGEEDFLKQTGRKMTYAEMREMFG